MAYIKINKDKLTPEGIQQLVKLCPFGAITSANDSVEISSGCKMCRLCVKNGPSGAMELVEDTVKTVDKKLWRGICVYADYTDGVLHPVSLELLGKATQLAKITQQPIYALLIGNDTKRVADTLISYGADRVYCFDDEAFLHFKVDLYANAFYQFIQTVKPSSILVGATNIGRSLAPKVAARCKTGLTADCTVLDMKENTDLVQIRPAFGGNIMAQIITPAHRPQFCTVRYKIFTANEPDSARQGEIIPLKPDFSLQSRFETVEIKHKAKEMDISDAEVIIAAGRGVKSADDLDMLKQLATLLGGQLACTRPLIEAGWMDAKKQIGLSGRTVKPKLIITCGVSGSVQFAAGMKGSDCIIAINSDENAPIFEVAHYAVIGDLYEVVPRLIKSIEGGNSI